MIYLLCLIIYVVTCYGFYVQAYTSMSKNTTGVTVYLCAIYPILLIFLGLMGMRDDFKEWRQNHE